ncbi:unnamed protein product [Ectocarpus fasciculatus]
MSLPLRTALCRRPRPATQLQLVLWRHRRRGGPRDRRGRPAGVGRALFAISAPYKALTTLPSLKDKVNYLVNALRVNSERWAYIETQVMENLDIDLDMVSAVAPPYTLHPLALL